MQKTQGNQEEPLLTIVVPIYNEALSLVKLLPELIQYCRERNWQMVLVNDGSTDNTSQILETYENNSNVKIFQHKVNRGYGGALKTGILNTKTPYVITIDADGQHELSDIDKMLRLTLEKDADLVVGKRGRQFRPNLYRTAGKFLIRMFIRILMPLPITDPNSGFKLYRTDLAKKYLQLCPNTMAFSDVITLLFINQRKLVLERPIAVRPRQEGKSTINVFTAVDTLVEILHLAMLINPLRIFIPLSLLCSLVGIGWGLPFVLMGRGVSVGAMLAIVVGVLFFFLGLIASQLAAIRIQMLENTQVEKENRLSSS